MKVGSLVVCTNNTNEQFINLRNHGNVIPELETVYLVRTFERGIYRPDKYAIRLEEIVNPVLGYIEGFLECRFITDYFKEVQPPMNIYDYITETKSTGLPEVNTKHPAEHSVASIKQC